MAILQGARVTGSIIATQFIKASGFSGSLTASRLYVQGSVGIGTSSPSAKLTIVDNTNGGTINLVGRTSDDTAAINFRATGDASTYAYVSPDTNEFRLYHNDGFMSFYPGGSEKVRITSGGNVGIGTTSPLAKLQVSAGRSYFFSGDQYSVGLAQTAAQANYMYLGTATDGTFYISETGGTARVTVQQSGNVGIGTTSPGAKLDVNGDVYISPNTAGKNTFILSTNASNDARLLMRSDTTTKVDIQANGASYFNGGNVGIGTTSPNTKLQVSGSVSVGGYNAVYSGTNVSSLNITAISYPVLAFYYGTTLAGTTTANSLGLTLNAPASKYISFEPGDSEKMRIASDGNVGIGTTSPATKLDVYGGNAIIRNDASGGSAILYLRNWASSPTTTMVFGNNTNDDSSTSLTLTNNIFSITNYGDPGSHIQFGTRNSSTSDIRMSINPDGNVGIGTTSPSNKTTIEADATGVSFADNGVGQLVIRGATNTAKRLGLGIDTTNNIGVIQAQLYGTGQYPLVLNPAGGNVGIGTTSPSFALDVTAGVGLNTSGTGVSLTIGANNATDKYLRIRNSNGNFEIGSSGNQHYLYGIGASNFFTIYTNSTERFRIAADGNVGIGTTSPTAKLQVVGTANVIELKQASVGSATYYVMDNTVETGGKRYRFGYSGASSDKGSFTIYNATDNITPFIITTSGSVGIGTTSPTQVLEVAGFVMGGTTYRTSIGASGAGAYIYFGDTSNLYSIGRMGGYNSLFNISSFNGPISFQISDSEKIRIDTSGNLGIGTTSPTSKLHIYDSEYSFIRCTNTANAGHYVDIGANSAGQSFLFSYGAYPVLIGTNGGERVRIDTSGNVGIGTTSPVYKLHTAGAGFIGRQNNYGSYDAADADLIISNYNSNNTSLLLFNSAGNYHSGLINYYNNILSLGLNDSNTTNSILTSTAINITSTGVGIGTTSPGAKLDVSGSIYVRSGYGLYSNIIAPYTGDLTFYTGGSERMRITGGASGGNVGIGTSSPAYKLEVASGTSGQQSLVNFRTADSTTANNAGIQIFATPSATATSREAVMALDADGANVSGGDYFLIKKRGNSGTTDFEQYSNASMRFGTNFISRATYDMTIANDGNVGIGTSSPSQKLYVVGAQIIENGHSDTRLQLYYPDAIESRKSYLTLWASEPGLSYNSCGIGGNINFSGQYYGRQTSGSAYGVYLHFDTSYGNAEFWSTTASPGSSNGQGTRKFYIDASGNAISTGGTRSTYADIGTTAGDIYIASNLNRLGQTAVPTVESQNASKAFVINHTGAQPILFGTNGSERMRIQSDGNVGIGTTSPGAKLDVVGNILINGASNSNIAQLAFTRTDVSWGIFNETDLRFYSSNSNTTSPSTLRMTLTSTGNVGIGTTSPTNKLHVSGSSTNLPLKLEGLTSNATGYFLTVDNTTGVVYKSTGGANGTSGTSGANGSPGTSGTSGANGSPGSSGVTGTSGSSGSSVGGSPVRAYVYFNGTGTVAINGSDNVSSITDNGVGDYTVNFTTAFVDAYYTVAGTCTLDFTNASSLYNVGLFVPRQANAQVAGSCRLACEYYNNTLYDCVAVRAEFVRA